MCAQYSGDDTLRFEEFEILKRERKVFVRGELAQLGSRAYDVLLALAERHGQVVSKRQLLDRAWPQRYVEENNVAVQVSNLRRVFGFGAIDNVAGQGYRLTTRRLESAPSADQPVAEVPARSLVLVMQASAGPVVLNWDESRGYPAGMQQCVERLLAAAHGLLIVV